MKTCNNQGRSATLVCVLALASGVLAGSLTGCRGDRSEKKPHQFFPDMDDSPKWKPQTETDFFVDGGSTMRPPVEGSIAFSRVNLGPEVVQEQPQWAQPFLTQRDNLLRDDGAYFFGVGTGGYVDSIPASVQVDKELLLRGQERFNIYCAVCHGYAADGKGMVGRQWSAPVPGFHDPKYMDRGVMTGKDGYLFRVARYGIAVDDQGQRKVDPDNFKQPRIQMPGYGHALDERDTWAVVAYIRALQESHRGSINDVPEAERALLNKQAQSGASRGNGGVQ
ncbi:MAG: cytochrome c [Planctomycetota bacterium]|nr:cytochrome c [Planctomycetota bacterium]